MNKQELKELLNLSFLDLLREADKIRRAFSSSTIDLCGICNAKCGVCSEDCKFCAQSGHYSTNISEYPLKSKNEIVKEALKIKESGATRYGIVTSGNKLTINELEVIAFAIKEIIENIGLSVCASLGALDERSFNLLKSAGLSRYHHNIETSKRFYPFIVSSHSYEERISTIKLARKAGLEVCSGGIIGMGETWEDRIDMALFLKELDVDSVPINILIPVKGTPLENIKTISPVDAIKTIALFRLILKDKNIRIAAGRESLLKDFMALVFMAGTNGMMVGGYLTTRGRSVEEDKELVSRIYDLWKIN
ncbi:biotin synthase [Candidatus Omnitrophus magneticus]|uniref:Biotin synthase n=1 Tax=Candidatus Omnitrophus magneticus TaxID=1609969 RepID=A0A0F0CPS2_9BACT|nr:biotin synthase [Candidatus Omnitrophus magneticus]